MSERAGVGAAVACLVYASTLALGIREAFAIDLGDGARPGYYVRGLVALTAGVVVGGLWGRKPRLPSELVAAWLMGAVVAVAAVLVVLFP